MTPADAFVHAVGVAALRRDIDQGRTWTARIVMEAWRDARQVPVSDLEACLSAPGDYVDWQYGLGKKPEWLADGTAGMPPPERAVDWDRLHTRLSADGGGVHADCGHLVASDGTVGRMPEPDREDGRPLLCAWTRGETDDDGLWYAACGNPFFFRTGDGPAENEFTFCPGCGGRILTNGWGETDGGQYERR